MNRRLAAAAAFIVSSALPVITMAQQPATGAEGAVGITGVWMFVVIFFGACAGFAWMVWRGGKDNKKK
ncbi:MAG: hypothetical protein ABIU95_09190 [Burkholderiales bacterium]